MKRSRKLFHLPLYLCIDLQDLYRVSPRDGANRATPLLESLISEEQDERVMCGHVVTTCGLQRRTKVLSLGH